MNIKLVLLTSVLAMSIASNAYAMRPGGGAPHEPPSVAHLQEALDLSDKQAESLKALFKEQRTKQKASRKEHREMRDQMHERISKILTKDQMEKFESMKPKKDCKRD